MDERNDWGRKRQDFLEECNRAAAFSRENLKELMEKNRDTEYGKRFHFGQIQGAADYQRLVPISDYSDYQSYVERMRQGEENLLTAYPVKHYIMTSGSTGVPKRIPLTTEALRRCADPIYYACFSRVPKIEMGRVLHLSVFRMEPPAPKVDAILSAAYFRELYDQGSYDLEHHYLGGTELLFSEGIGEVPYVKLWIALSSPDMRGIQAFFLYDILVFLRYFEGNWERILNAVRTRTIPETVPLFPKVREALLALPVPEDEWFLKVEEECRKGFHGIVKRLWKDCAWVSGVGGSSFGVQEQALRNYLGDVQLHYFSYAASECMIAITTEMESIQNVLIPRSGFFEFLPWDDRETDTRPRTIEELEVGKRYEILLTNFSGLYRYRLNDVVKITGFCGEAPVMEVCFRQNQAINIAGEKMDMQTVSMAAEQFAAACGFRMTECSLCADPQHIPGRYLCFYETDRVVERNAEADQILDGQLRQINEDYEDLRNLGLIVPAAALQVQRGTHEACKKQFQSDNRQNKPLQLLEDQRMIDFMLQHLQGKKDQEQNG